MLNAFISFSKLGFSSNSLSCLLSSNSTLPVVKSNSSAKPSNSFSKSLLSSLVCFSNSSLKRSSSSLRLFSSTSFSLRWASILSFNERTLIELSFSLSDSFSIFGITLSSFNLLILPLNFKSKTFKASLALRATNSFGWYITLVMIGLISLLISNGRNTATFSRTQSTDEPKAYSTIIAKLSLGISFITRNAVSETYLSLSAIRLKTWAKCVGRPLSIATSQESALNIGSGWFMQYSIKSWAWFDNLLPIESMTATKICRLAEHFR